MKLNDTDLYKAIETDSKPLPESVLAKIPDAKWRH